MGCCTSAPMPEVQQGPAPTKAPNGGSAAPQSAAATTAAANAANRTVTVNGAKPADKNATANKGQTARSDIKGQQRYEISPGVLGKGHFAVVKKCRDTLTGQTYAVKIIDKKEMVKSTAGVVKQEIEILRAVGAHPNIVQLIDHFEDSTKHYLVMELCMGGDLFSQIVEHGKYSEQEAVSLKPENILLTSASPESPLKLADFGLSKLIKGHSHPMRTVCGTWAYCVAPETQLKFVDSAGKMRAMRADLVTRETMLVDEHYRPVRVKAIHTTERSREQLWSVRDEHGALLFRCTGDHKLSLIERTSAQEPCRRVEVRCQDFARLSPLDRERYQGYTASPAAAIHAESGLKHVGRAFSIRVAPPAEGAPIEQFIGIEVASSTHRYVLASDVVTSNCAPEVIQRKPYNNTVDNWTLGVLMYILLSGYHPFDVFGDCAEPELLQKIITCSYDFDDPVWETISQSAKDLIRNLLVLDPSKRLSLDAYLASPWINDGKDVSAANNTLVVERLSKFSVGKTKFRTLVMLKIASNKFKASISKSKTRNQSQDISVPVLANGEPDYLGLGSERGGAPGSARSRIQLEGLESVREGNLNANATPQTGGDEASNSANGSGAARPALSVNNIDTAVAQQTGRSDRTASVDATEEHSTGGPTIHEGDMSPTPIVFADRKGGLGRGSLEMSQSQPATHADEFQ